MEHETAREICLRIPAQPSWYLRFVLGVWLCGWLLSEVAAITQLGKAVTGTLLPRNPPLLLALWLLFWTLAGFLTAFTFAWNIAGQEMIELDADRLLVSRRIGTKGTGQAVTRQNIQSVKVCLPFTQQLLGDTLYNLFYSRAGAAVTGWGRGTIAVETVSGETLRFGLGLSREEAERLASFLTARLPNSNHPSGRVPDI